MKNVEFTRNDLERIDYIFKTMNFCLENNYPVLFSDKVKQDIFALGEQFHNLLIDDLAAEIKNNEGGEI